MHHYYLYRLTSPTGKVYVGQSRRLTVRFNAYRLLQCKSQPLLYESLKQHGWDSHVKDILKEGLMTQQEIDTHEVAAIASCKARGISLNIAVGGTGWNGHQGSGHSKSIPILRFDLDGVFIDRWENANQAAQAIGQLDGRGIHNALSRKRWYAHGYLWVKESDYLVGVRPTWEPKTYPVVQFALDGTFVAEYPTISEAARAVGGHLSPLSSAVHGKSSVSHRHTAYGYLWLLKKDYDSGTVPVPKPSAKGWARRVPVVHHTADGQILDEYVSLAEAARQTGHDRATISNHCRGHVLNSRFRYRVANPLNQAA